MDFNQASNIASLLAKSFTRDFFRLLATHRDISASEAASRLDLHIRTAQDFLEGLFGEGIVSRKEVVEGKRPYFRYSLKQRNIKIDLNLDEIHYPEKSYKNQNIREKSVYAHVRAAQLQVLLMSLRIFLKKYSKNSL